MIKPLLRSRKASTNWILRIILRTGFLRNAPRKRRRDDFGGYSLSGYIELPQGWTRIRSIGIGPFITLEEYRSADGSRVVWKSRYHRKHPPGVQASGTTWWAPHSISWWIGVLIIVAALVFTAGTIPSYVTLVGATMDSATFLAGCVIFTPAAVLMVLEVVATPTTLKGGNPHRKWRLFQLSRIDWWASVTQLLGVLLFLRSMSDALLVNLTVAEAEKIVWRPDLIGSLCFLIATGLSWFEVCNGLAAWRPRDISWWICLLWLLGSVAFMFSAAGAYIVPSTGQLYSLELTDLGFMVGAILFGIGAVLMLPERTS